MLRGMRRLIGRLCCCLTVDQTVRLRAAVNVTQLTCKVKRKFLVLLFCNTFRDFRLIVESVSGHITSQANGYLNGPNSIFFLSFLPFFSIHPHHLSFPNTSHHVPLRYLTADLLSFLFHRCHHPHHDYRHPAPLPSHPLQQPPSLPR